MGMLGLQHNEMVQYALFMYKRVYFKYKREHTHGHTIIHQIKHLINRK